MGERKKYRSLADLPEFCTLAELSGILGISKATAYRMAAQGQIPCMRLGRRIILSKEHLKQWIGQEIKMGRTECLWQDV